MKNIIELKESEAAVLYELPDKVPAIQHCMSEPALDDLTIQTRSRELENGLVFRLRRPDDRARREIAESGQFDPDGCRNGTLFSGVFTKTAYNNYDMPIESCKFFAYLDKRGDAFIGFPHDCVRFHSVDVLIANDRSVSFTPSILDAEDKCISLAAAGLRLFLASQFLLLHHTEYLTYETAVTKRPAVSAARKHKSKYRRQKKQSPSIVRMYHMVNFDEEAAARVHAGAKHRITCPVWGVRGHYRHLANGRVVYVRPYKKGKAREREGVTQYVLFPEERGKSDHVHH